MRKKKYLKSVTSVVLAVTMLFSQAGTTGASDLFTDQPVEWGNGEIFDDGESGTGEAVFTSDENPELITEGKTQWNSETDADPTTETAAKPELTASVCAAEEGSNIWHINADWMITNTQGQSVLLAFTMDDQTRQALPADYQAGEDGILRFRLTDGTELPLTIQSVETTPDKIYLTTEQAADGTYHLDFVLQTENVKTDVHSSLGMVVYDEETQVWSEAAHAELDWRAIQEEEPKVTETPEEPTAAPEEPAPTIAPEEPEPTTAPEEPMPTATPETPDPTAAPEESQPTESPEEPDPTSAPEESQPTETPETSEPTDAPAETEITETQEEAEPTTVPAESTPSESLEPTVTPTVEPTEVPEDTSADEEGDSNEKNEADAVFVNEEENNENTEEDVIQNNSEDEMSSSAVADIEGEPQATGKMVRRLARAISGGSVDMTDYITDASFSSTTVQEGKSVKVSLAYQVDSSVLKAKGTTKITYEIPEGIDPILDYSGIVYNKKGEAVGTYSVSKDGFITIDLYESFVNSGDTITGAISFRATLDKTTDEDSEDHTYIFSQSNKIEAEIKITKKPSEGSGEDQKNYDVSVDKTYTFDSITNKASYTVIIGTESGTGGDFYFNDYLTKPDNINVQVTDLSKMIFKKYDKNGNENTLNAAEYFRIDDKGNIILQDGKKLPELEEGCRYELVYDIIYDSDDLKKVNGDVRLSNTAAAWDDTGHRDQSTVDIELSHTYISKTAYYDKENDKIVWTITLNDFGHDINGYVLEDTLKKDGVVASLPDTLNVTEYLPDGTQNSFTIQMTDGSYTFEAGKDIKDTKSRFVITYETPVSDAGFHATYNNEATFEGEDSGTHTSNPGDVHVTHSDGLISKSLDRKAVAETDENGNTIYKWDVTLRLPSPDGIKAGATYTDSMTANAENQWILGCHYITASQLKGLKVIKYEGYEETPLTSEVDYKIVKVKSDREWVDYTGNEEGTFTDFKIEFLKDIAYGEKINLGIVYKTTAHTPDGKTVLYKNEGTFEQDGGSTSSYDEEKESKGGYIIKVDKGGSGTNTYEYDECKGILYYCIMVNTTRSLKAGDGKIIIEDTLPEGTTLYMEQYRINAEHVTNDTGLNDTESHVKLYYDLDTSTSSICPAYNRYDPNYIPEYKINETSDVKILYDVDRNKLRIEIEERAYFGEWRQNEKYSLPISIYYAAKLTTPPVDKDEGGNKLPYKTYTNKASINIKDKEYTDSVTDTVTSSIVSKQIKPDGDAADNETSYRVLFNPEGATLNGGNDVELVDSITYNENSFLKGVSLKPHSLHLYNLLPDGSNGAEIDQALYTVSYEEKGSGDNKQFEMKLKVKDNTPYVLEYTFVFGFDAEEYFGNYGEAETVSTKVTNGISVNGSTSNHEDSKVEDEFIISSSEASADTDRNITIIKVDEDNNVVTLKGAAFRLDKLKDGSKSYTADDSWERGKTYITGQDGTVKLSGIKPGIAYRLEEVEAPTNYELPEGKYTYFYLAKEGAVYPEGFTAVAFDIEAEYLTITNKKSDSDNTSIDVQKLWLDAKGQPLVGDKITDAEGNVIDSIEIKLWQTTDQDDISEASNIETVMISNDDNDNWYYIFNDLPAKSNEGDNYFYYITETGKAVVKVVGEDGKVTATTKEIELDKSYLSSIDSCTPTEAGTFVLTNTKLPGKTDISVEKKWAGDGQYPDKIPVTLYRSKSGIIPEDEEEPEPEEEISYEVIYSIPDYNGGSSQKKCTGTIRGTINNSNKLVLTANYQWAELKEEASVSYDGGESEASIDNLKVNIGETYNYSSIFTVPVKSKDIKIYVEFKTPVNSENFIVSANIITTEIPSTSKKPWNLPLDYEEVRTVYLGSAYAGKLGYDDTGWKYTWSDLDDGYYYYVLENGKATSISGYDAEYEYTLKESEGDIKPVDCVTITNTQNGKKIFTVIKEWQEFTPDSTYVVTAQLYKNGAKEGEPFELTQENGWTKTWENLDDGASYTVQEVKVTCKDSSGIQQEVTSGFDVTYSNGSDGVENTGTITITNTKKSQGIILPETGSKYSFVFYGLGLAFLLIPMIWMLLTFKKSNKQIDAGKGGRRLSK